MTPFFPVALNLQGRRCLVVGGGTVAQRKIDALLDAAAQVVVVAPRISGEIEALGLLRALEIRLREYRPDDLDGVFLVVAATDDRAANARVAADARERGVLVNAVDDPDNCDFITPAVVRRGDVQVAVTTGGASPALARHLRELLERTLPPEYAALADLLAEVRSELRRDGVRADPEDWQLAIRGALRILETGDVEKARQHLRTTLEVTPPPNAPSEGRIVLVGAGPGDPGLLTIAGRDAIADADVVVYDRLVNPALLEYARSDAQLVYAGKRRGGGSMTQAEINDLLCAEALAGKVVVRLKGGDPFVFGRGGEEVLAARAAAVPCTVIPGITAAVAAPAAAGIPVTHRGLSSAFTVVTGHEDPGKPDGAIDWDALAQLGGTLVLLMGVETLPQVCQRLIDGGLPNDTPAAVIQSGTTEEQRVVGGDLATIAELARLAGVQAPATTVIGEVAALATQASETLRAATGGAHGTRR
jgi:uroporphyrin-III C-methyltransferase/precorrin-2 dehydrogenase/sirohydrochlorin ferrochelatase